MHANSNRLNEKRRWDAHHSILCIATIQRLAIVESSLFNCRQLLKMRLPFNCRGMTLPGIATLVKPGCGVQLVVILLGTNDLFQQLADNNPDEIAANIIAMHTVAHDVGDSAYFGVNHDCIYIFLPSIWSS